MDDAESGGDFDAMEENPKDQVENKQKDDKSLNPDLKANQEVNYN